MQVHALEHYRLSQGISRAQLAERLGLSRGAVHRYITGRRRAKPAIVRHISEVTGIPPRELRPDLADLIEGA